MSYSFIPIVHSAVPFFWGVGGGVGGGLTVELHPWLKNEGEFPAISKDVWHQFKSLRSWRYYSHEGKARRQSSGEGAVDTRGEWGFLSSGFPARLDGSATKTLPSRE